jgi:hypothetical protein
MAEKRQWTQSQSIGRKEIFGTGIPTFEFGSLIMSAGIGLPEPMMCTAMTRLSR